MIAPVVVVLRLTWMFSVSMNSQMALPLSSMLLSSSFEPDTISGLRFKRSAFIIQIGMLRKPDQLKPARWLPYSIAGYVNAL